MPKRLRKKHLYDYEWKKNPNTVFVARPSRWGNPYKVPEYELEESLRKYSVWLLKQLHKNPYFVDELIGKDLVCYCSLDQKCHADILLNVANSYVIDDDSR